jgi:phage-related protein
MAGNPRIVVDFVPDTSELNTGFKQAESAGSKFAGTLKSVGKAGALAAGAAGVGALIYTVKTGIGEWEESQKVTAQTEAVLKSTGKAAGVTSQQVQDLAGSIMKKTGIDDEAIQSGENLLLTFTNIRDEAGKGNDIFTQSTRIMADMSTALGQDMKTSAIQLGKALNDPVKGMSALRRVGVSFTEAQKTAVEQMVKSGDTMGAQKLILRELNKEFGGSAEAIGKTLPGQLSIVRESFNNFAGDLVGKTIPYIEKVISYLQQNWPAISAAIQQGWDAVKPAVQAFGDALKALGDLVVAVVQVISDHWNLIAPIIKANVQVIKDAFKVIGDIFKVVTDLLHGNWSKAWQDFRTLVSDAVKLLVDSIKARLLPLVTVLGALWDGIKAAAAAAWNGIKSLVTTIVDSIKGSVTTAWNQIKTTVTTITDSIKSAMTTAWNAIKGVFTSAVSSIRNTVSSGLGALAAIATSAGQRLMSGLTGAVHAGVAAVTGAIGAVKAGVVGAFAGAGSWLISTGQAIVAGLANGIRGAIGAAVAEAQHLASSVIGAAKGALHIGSPSQVFYDFGQDTVQGLADGIKDASKKAEQAALEMAAKTIQAARGPLASASGSLADLLGQAFQARQAGQDTAAGKQLKALQDSHDEAARQQALADANAQLAAATNADEVLAAQKAVEQAKYDIQVAALQQRAEQQQKALQGSQFVQQQAFDASLKSLQTYLASAHATAAGARTRIKAIMDRFGIDFGEIGSLLGKSMAKGINDSIDDVVQAAKKLANAVKDATKDGLKIKSPSRVMRDEVGREVARGLALGITQNTGLVNRALALAVPQMTAAATGAAEINAGSSTEVRVFIGDQELRGLVKSEIVAADTGLARTLLAGTASV